MEHIAILTGGDSAEYEISLLSANTVLQHLNSELFKGYIVHLKDNVFTVIINNQSIAIDKTNFSFNYKNKKIKLEKVFMALHGPPAENGLIQPYFDNLTIPYTSCNATVSALTFVIPKLDPAPFGFTKQGSCTVSIISCLSIVSPLW